MQKLRINRKTWYRGFVSDSYLRRIKDQKMCCLGFYCRSIGYTVRDILGLSTPQDLFSELSYDKLKGLVNADGGNAYITQNLIEINDFEISTDKSINLVTLFKKDGSNYEVKLNSEADRERLIKQQFKLLKVDVEFFN